MMANRNVYTARVLSLKKKNLSRFKDKRMNAVTVWNYIFLPSFDDDVTLKPDHSFQGADDVSNLNREMY